MKLLFMQNIKHREECFTQFPNPTIEKWVETENQVFLITFKVFGNRMNRFFGCLIKLLNH